MIEEHFNKNPESAAEELEKLKAAHEKLKREYFDLYFLNTHYEAFFFVIKQIQKTTDIKRQLDVIARGIVRAHTYRRALIYLLDDWKIIIHGSYGLTKEELRFIENDPTTAKERRSFIQDKFKIGKSYYVPHTAEENVAEKGISSKRLLEDFVDWHPDDLLFVPLYGLKKEIIGLISVDDPYDGKRPTQKSLRILEAFAELAGAVIEKNQLYNKTEEMRINLKKLIENSPNMIITTDNDGMIDVFNMAAVKILKCSREKKVNKHISSIMENPGEYERIMDFMKRSDVDEQGVVKNYEMNLINSESELIPVQLSGACIYDSEGFPKSIEWILTDMRKVKEMEKQLIKMEEIKMLVIFAATISHKINNNLNVIELASNRLKRIFKNDEIAGLLEEGTPPNFVDSLIEDVENIEENMFMIQKNIDKINDMAVKGDVKIADYTSGGHKILDIEEEKKEEKIPAKQEYEHFEGNPEVLLVDDEEGNRTYLAKVLNELKYNVDTAQNGTDAINKIDHKQFDLIISDIKMPDKTGYEVLHFAKTKWGDQCKVILMTAFGYDPDHILVKASAEGLQGVIYKPFSEGKIKKVINKHLPISKNE